MKFDTQEKSGVNKFGHYQFGTNCCIACKVDRPLNAKGMWCDGCINYQNIHKDCVDKPLAPSQKD